MPRGSTLSYFGFSTPMPGEKDREQIRMMLAYLSNTASGERLDKLENELRDTLDRARPIGVPPAQSDPPKTA